MAVIRLPDGSTLVGLIEDEDKEQPSVADAPVEKPKKAKKTKE